MISSGAETYGDLSCLPDEFWHELLPNIIMKLQVNSQIEDKFNKNPSKSHLRPEQQDMSDMSSHILIVVYNAIRVLEENNAKKWWSSSCIYRLR